MNNKDEPQEIQWIADEAADPAARMHVGYDDAGRRMWHRFTPYHAGPSRVAELARQMAAGPWRPQLDEASAQAAGPDYAERRRLLLDPTPLSREEALRLIHEAIDTARARGWVARAVRSSGVPDSFPRPRAALDARRSPGGGKSNVVGEMLAAYVRAGWTPSVVDPENYLTNVTWPTQQAQPDDLVDRIDQVVGEAERLIASVRSARRSQRDRDDLRRMFGDQR